MCCKTVFLYNTLYLAFWFFLDHVLPFHLHLNGSFLLCSIMFIFSLVCTGKWSVLEYIFLAEMAMEKNEAAICWWQNRITTTVWIQTLKHVRGMVHLFGQSGQSCHTNVSWQWIYLHYTIHSEKCQSRFCWSFTFAQVIRSPIMLLRSSKRTHCLGYKHCMICVGRKLALLELAPWQDGLSQFIRYNAITVIALDK